MQIAMPSPEILSATSPNALYQAKNLRTYKDYSLFQNDGDMQSWAFWWQENPQNTPDETN